MMLRVLFGLVERFMAKFSAEFSVQVRGESFNKLPLIWVDKPIRSYASWAVLIGYQNFNFYQNQNLGFFGSPSDQHARAKIVVNL